MSVILFLTVMGLVSLLYLTFTICILSLVSLGILHLITKQKSTNKQQKTIVVTYITIHVALIVLLAIVIGMGQGEREIPSWSIWLDYVGMLIVGTIAGFVARERHKK